MFRDVAEGCGFPTLDHTYRWPRCAVSGHWASGGRGGDRPEELTPRYRSESVSGPRLAAGQIPFPGLHPALPTVTAHPSVATLAEGVHAGEIAGQDSLSSTRSAATVYSVGSTIIRWVIRSCFCGSNWMHRPDDLK